MFIEYAIRDYLLADSAIVAHVSARIYPMALPQKPTYPAIVYARISGPRLHHLGGASGRALPRLSLHCWGGDYDQAKALAGLVRARLDGFNGTFADDDSPADIVRATIMIDNEIDDYDDTVKKFRVIQDYRVSHTEV